VSNADDYCAYNAQKFLHWALEDERIIGVFPFYWGVDDSWWYLPQLPQCLEAYSGIGKTASSWPTTHQKTFKDGTCRPTAPIRDYEWCNRNRK